VKKIFCVFGTRPEAIKMVPVVKAFKESPDFRVRTVVTAQHREMLDEVLSLFGLKSDYDLNIMRSGQTLTDVTARALEKLEPVLKKERPDLLLVHGDTTTTLAASIAAFYQKIPVGHVEAGLRSGDIHNPYPEEINRKLADAVAVLHFAPTRSSRENLRREGVASRGIFVTGNTGIDALRLGVERLSRGRFPRPSARRRALAGKPFVLITAHRRENFGRPLEEFCRALRAVAEREPGTGFIYPVHPNPNVTGPAHRLLKGAPNIHLLPPLNYGEFLYFLTKARFVVTDSGGLQEEAPSLGKPVLVLRRVTERPEAVTAGTVRLVGTETALVRKWIARLLHDASAYRRMAEAVNPYGDGRAGRRILQAVRHYFSPHRPRPQEFRA